MAANRATSSVTNRVHKKRPGVISKCRTSKLKGSKHYVKAYRGQGR